MKKSTLALAVAAALVGFGSAAYADTTLYGSARVSVDYEDFDTTYRSDESVHPIDPVTGRYEVLVPGSNAWDVFNDASRLGVRGEEDLGGGLERHLPVRIRRGHHRGWQLQQQPPEVGRSEG